MKKIIISFIAVFAIQITAFADLPYTDVPWSHKYAESIDRFTPRYFEGYQDGSFKPERVLNRAELLKLVIESEFPGNDRSYHANRNCFSDVGKGDWYAEYVCFAEEKGIVNGYSDGSFRPNEPIKLVEAVKIFKEATRAYNDWPEYATSSPWYKIYIDNTSSIPLDFKSFSQEVTRAQFANLLDRSTADLAYMYPALHFLFDRKVNFETLSNGIDVEAIAKSTDFLDSAAVTFDIDYGLPSTYRAVVYSDNAVKKTYEGCSKDYYLGNFSFAIVSLKGNQADQLISQIPVAESAISIPADNPLHLIKMPIQSSDLPAGIPQINQDPNSSFFPIVLLEKTNHLYGCEFGDFYLFQPGNAFYSNPSPMKVKINKDDINFEQTVPASGIENFVVEENIISTKAFSEKYLPNGKVEGSYQFEPNQQNGYWNGELIRY